MLNARPNMLLWCNIDVYNKKESVLCTRRFYRVLHSSVSKISKSVVFSALFLCFFWQEMMQLNEAQFKLKGNEAPLDTFLTSVRLHTNQRVILPCQTFINVLMFSDI